MQEYFWQCPSMVCPPVSDDCETVEFLVYAFQYRLPSSTTARDSTTSNDDEDDDDDGEALVSVHCESCRYCLDRPSRTPRSRSRSRTSRSHVHQQTRRRRRFAAIETPALGPQVRRPNYHLF